MGIVKKIFQTKKSFTGGRQKTTGTEVVNPFKLIHKLESQNIK